MLRFILFLVINFAALFIGNLLMGDIRENTWYQLGNKAPWTPPGWVFGAAWFSIMFFYAIFLAMATKKPTYSDMRLFYGMYFLQWLLNVGWNPVFFRYHQAVTGLIIISMLFLVVCWFTWYGFRYKKWAGLFMLPYTLWLMIAISLNAYFLANN